MSESVTSRVWPGQFAWTVIPPGTFRIGLACAVMVSHLSRIDIGRLGVVLFFFLSGYWVSMIWERRFSRGAIGRFYASRYLRIVPLYLIVAMGAAFARGQWMHLENWTLLGVASTGRDPTGVSWSLDVELQFYLLLPLIFAAIKRLPWMLAMGISLAVSVFGIWLFHRFDVVTVAKYLPAFVAGALTYAKAWKPSARAANLSLAGFLAFTVFTALFTPFFDMKSPDPFETDIYAFFWMLPLIPYVVRSLGVRSGAMDRHVGNLTFPLYLVHYPIIALAFAQFGDSIPVKLACVPAAVLVALVLYVGIDRPLDRWRVALTEKGVPTAA